MLTPAAIQEFKLLYLEEEGVELSDQEASELAHRLFEFMRTITKPPVNMDEKIEDKVKDDFGKK